MMNVDMYRWISEFEKKKEQLALDVTNQMGKPLAESRGEVATAIARAKALIELAPKALADEEITLGGAADLHRRIAKEPIGVVLSLVPWNYPLLCAVNTVITAVLAGNSVLLKHSDRTPLCADAFANAFVAAGAPKALVQVSSVPYQSYH
jgi:acyl-CoA reductase-like NAD-dependent aldehyde dehydrogenase